MIVQPRDTGWIEVVCGPMFSGKTEELIRRLKRALIAGQSVQAFKPRIDNRYDKLDIASHDGRRIEAEVVDDVKGIRALVREDTEVVGIDEVQFFSGDVVSLCRELADGGVRVVASGLDQDYLARPFGPMPELLAEAEFVTKSLAICVLCGNPAHRSHRYRARETTAERDSTVVVGAAEAYRPLCRRCHRSQQATADALMDQGRLSLQTPAEER